MKSLVVASFLVTCGPLKEQPNIVEPPRKATINGAAAGIEVVPPTCRSFIVPEIEASFTCLP